MYGMNQAYNVPQDPSVQVPNQLLPHIHLVSSYRFPTLPSLQPQQALEYLTKAPEIVRNAAPVAWTFFTTPPPDGTALLMWQPPRMGTHFASDGLIWADAELSYEMNLNGFQLQVLVHKSGFFYPHEPFATHARFRYRITNGPRAFDDKLWLVHYSMAEPTMRIPAQNIPVTREIQQQLATRGQLQQAGQLIRKEFMLGDTANFPKVEFAQPGVRPQPSPYGANPMTNRYPYGQQQPPAKRARTAQPPRPGVTGAAVDDLDEQENATQDTFDFMTPRDISLSRYKQHHEWMEEIFSSPHAFPKIKPIDLGVGLMGELAPLTADILDAATGDAPIDKEGNQNPNYGKTISSYTQLTPEKLKEFEKRVSDYEAKEQAEIERMKAAHANKMAALKRSRTYIKAERRLRDSPRTASTDGDSPDPSDMVVSDLEKSLGVVFDTKKLVVCVDKGGFIEAQQPQPERLQVNGNGSTPSNANGGTNGSAQEGNVEGDNTAASLLDQFGSGSLGGTPIGNISLPALSQPQSQAQSAVATPNAAPSDAIQNSTLNDQAAHLDPSSAANDLLDLDVEMSGIANADGKGDAEWVMVENQGNAQQSGANNVQPPTSNDASADASAMTTSGVDAEVGGMFDTADFGSFDNLDTAGDALADYTNVGDDNMGLDLVDDSAFGDAFHGTEMHHGETGEGNNA